MDKKVDIRNKYDVEPLNVKLRTAFDKFHVD